MLELKLIGFSREKVVGVQGFEPWTPCSQSRCATRLRYTPTESIFYTDRAVRGKSCKIRGMVAYFYSKFTKQIHAAFAVFLLLVCLLGTNWIGLSHSIAHANLQGQTDQITSSLATTSATHSSDVCHLFDALTLAGFIGSSFVPQVANLFHPGKINSPKETVVALQSIASYRSRAPPTTLL